MIVLSVVMALLAALGNAAASVLQRQAAAADLADTSGGRPGGRFGFVRRPAWRWGRGSWPSPGRRRPWPWRPARWQWCSR